MAWHGIAWHGTAHRLPQGAHDHDRIASQQWHHIAPGGPQASVDGGKEESCYALLKGGMLTL